MCMLLLAECIISRDIQIFSYEGFDVVVTEGSNENQTVRLDVFYELPSSVHLDHGEVLLSPYIVVEDMSENESSLELTVPFLQKRPKHTESMAKWIRFFGSTSAENVPMWQDIRTAEELDVFTVEIGDDYAKIHTQQNVTFCIVGSTDENAVLYDYGAGIYVLLSNLHVYTTVSV